MNKNKRGLYFEYKSLFHLKRFYKESDYIRLQPENDSMDPIISKDVTVVGKVRGVFRYLS